MLLQQYVVTWQAEIDAESPADAATQAMEMLCSCQETQAFFVQDKDGHEETIEV
jgi:hypothetical protein